MLESKTCPQCGSTQIMTDVRVADALDEDLGAQVQRKPRAMLLKGTVRVQLKAQVCGECGYTELYAADPGRLLEAHRRGRSNALSGA